MAEPALADLPVEKDRLLRRFNARLVILPRVVRLGPFRRRHEVDHPVVPVAEADLLQCLPSQHPPEVLLRDEGLDVHDAPVQEEDLLFVREYPVYRPGVGLLKGELHVEYRLFVHHHLPRPVHLAAVDAVDRDEGGCLGHREDHETVIGEPFREVGEG
ncbi:MAG: hypothetical protein ABSC19_11870 [Syntrophorhabdales bacterium]